MRHGHVLALYDGSAESRAAVATAASIARERRVKLALAVVIDTAGPRACCGMSTGKWQALMRAEALEELHEAASALEDDVEPQLMVLEGTPADAVGRAAPALGCDLIIVPAPSQNRVVRVLRGRPARGLERLTRCEVFRVPA